MRKNRLSRVGILLAAFCFSLPALAKDVVVHAGQLIDGVSDKSRKNVSILIRDDRIQSVETGFVAPEGFEVVDLSKATVLPGLIECHDHISLAMENGPLVIQVVKNTGYDDLVNAIVYSRRTLEAGFTTVRDLGGYTPTMVALKKGIDAGKIEGPRLWIAGGVIAPTGGHGDYSNGFDPSLHKPAWEDNVVDSPEAGIKMVRQRHKDGTKVIKIAVSGGMISDGDDPNAQLMTDEEIKAIVDTAHTLGMTVAAHAHGKTAIEHASELGVDSIEHGTFADEKTYAIMKKNGTYLVPTLLAGEVTAEFMRKHPGQLSPSAMEKITSLGPLTGRNVHNAYKAGVKIAFGTDTAASPHGANAREFALMVRAGMPTMATIKSATSVAAELLGASDDIGSVQAGRYADLVATAGDPLSDVTELERPIFVMKGGSIVKSEK